ncbi:hypothetical protein [Pseudooceanicola sp.]|uniref:hypothetical protein n=1 Tax=Pseudooceanicola sp. TaxID=1914328 RepID=UPI0035C6D67A
MRQQAVFFLDDKLRSSARNGRHNFICHLVGVLRDNGYAVDFRPEAEMHHSRPPRAMTHMAPPPPGGLTFRRVYHYPFWAIETTSERWEWTVAQKAFSAETVSNDQANRLYHRWQTRLFPETSQSTTREGFAYVPLQGRLLKHRSFQSCAPIDMLRHTLDAERERQVIATLHPGEVYTPEEQAALTTLQAKHPRLTLRTGGMEALLQRCDYVVTMNSAAAFNGYFFGKPCILFARIDFHHIALKASPEDLTAFDRIRDHHPDYARYIIWFWQENCINAGCPDVRETIRAALIRGGWPMQPMV